MVCFMKEQRICVRELKIEEGRLKFSIRCPESGYKFCFLCHVKEGSELNEWMLDQKRDLF